jgi:hypothetical protein
LNWSSRRIAAVAVAAGCGWLAALAAPRDFPVGSYGDDARYVVLAKALREGGRYRLLQVPGEPAETMFPPGYPAALALVWSPSRSGADNLERARWVNLALAGPLAGALCLAGMTLFALPAGASAALALGAVVAPIVMARWVLPLSEPLCLLLLVAGLLLWAAERPRYRWAGVVLLVAAAYVRTVAVAFLIGAWVVAWRRGERRRVAVEAVAAAGGLAPWVVWTALHAGDVPPALYGMYGSYGQWYAASLLADPVAVLFLVPLKNAWLLLASLGDALSGLSGAPVAVATLVGAAVVWAAWRARRAAPAVLAGLGCYAVIVLMWPYPPLRFVGAVWPLVLLAVAAGAAGRRGRTVHAVAAVALVLALVGFARRAGLQGAGGTWDWRPFVRTIGPFVPGDAVLASSNPALYYLTLGVQGVPNERMRSYRFYRLGFWSTAWGLGDDLEAILRRYRPAEVLVERRGTEGRYAVGSLMRQCPGVLAPLWSTPGGEFLFTVRNDVPCSPARVER